MKPYTAILWAALLCACSPSPKESEAETAPSDSVAIESSTQTESTIEDSTEDYAEEKDDRLEDEEGSGLYYGLECDACASVIGYKQVSEDLVIPPHITIIFTVGPEGMLEEEGDGTTSDKPFGFSVTSIGYEVFMNNETIKTVTLPNVGASFKYILDKAFYNCPNLTSVTIPTYCEEIGDSAFCNCPNLDLKIMVSKRNLKSGKNAFYGCRSVTYLDSMGNAIDDALYKDLVMTDKENGERAGDGGTKLYYGLENTDGATVTGYIRVSEKLDIPSNVSLDFKDGAVAQFANKENVFNVTSIGEEAFINNEKIEVVKMPLENTYFQSIRKKAFYNCPNLKNITISKYCRSIEDSAFCACSKLDVIIYSKKENIQIGEDAFKGCRSVTYVE